MTATQQRISFEPFISREKVECISETLGHSTSGAQFKMSVSQKRQIRPCIHSPSYLAGTWYLTVSTQVPRKLLYIYSTFNPLAAGAAAGAWAGGAWAGGAWVGGRGLPRPPRRHDLARVALVRAACTLPAVRLRRCRSPAGAPAGRQWR